MSSLIFSFEHKNSVLSVAAGGVVVASACQLLRRGCTYEQLVTAVNTCVLTIDQQEYDKAREELISEAQGDFFFRLNINAGMIPD